MERRTFPRTAHPASATLPTRTNATTNPNRRISIDLTVSSYSTDVRIRRSSVSYEDVRMILPNCAR
jgi:hypothetical protein